MPFKQPSQADTYEAIGLGVKDRSGAFYDLYPQYSKISSADWGHFVPDTGLYSIINQPGPSDWLQEHPEVGQTYMDFYNAPRNIIGKPRDTIYVRPCAFGNNVHIPDKTLLELIEYAEIFFGSPVRLDKPSASFFEISSRKNPWTGNYQVNARQVLRYLTKSLPSNAFCLAAVTLSDLYPQDSWNFVFGLASLNERCGVYSLARFVESFPRPPSVDDFSFDNKQLLRLTKNVMCHEIGHMFGMRHCVYFKCLMNGSNHRLESESRPSQLCPVCLRKLQSACKFDVTQRYERLQSFATAHGITDEASWCQEWLSKHNTK